MENTEIISKWWFWLILLAGGGLFIGIFFLIKKAIANPQVKPKNYTYTNPTTGKTETISFAPAPLTDALHDAINTPWSFFYTYRDLMPFKNLLALEDGQFVAVATDWNERYKKEYEESLRQAIRGEVLPDSKALCDGLEAKFNRLNII